MRVICKSLLIFFLLGISFCAKGEMPKGVVMKAKTVHYNKDKDSITATGDIVIQMENYTLNADKIHYKIQEDLIFAEGNIRIIDDKGKIVQGERAVLKDKLKRGVIKEFIVQLEDDSIVASRLANRIDSDHLTLEKSVFTPCSRNCGKRPIWQINAAHTNIDYKQQKVTYKHVLFEVYGVPIMYTPYFAHPTPNASAQSGFLVPRVKDGSLMIPFYFRAKPNLDFTISPRVGKGYMIFEGDMRHKVPFGQYDITGSYANSALQKKYGNKIVKKEKFKRYHVLSRGDFQNKGVHYGFELRRASDKAYLVNYQKTHDSYLTSRIYTYTVNKRNYFSLEGLSFQDLRSRQEKEKQKTPFVLPTIRTQNIYSLNDEESLLLNMRNNFIVYKEPDREIARASVDLELMKKMISNQGHMFTFTLANRGDLYFTNFISPDTGQDKFKKWYRNIPEFRTQWRYPLARRISKKSSVALEPTAMVVIGKRYKPRFKKFELIDAPKSELSENNIFLANSFSGIDLHDYGNRLSYGLRSSLISDVLYLNAFLGQQIHEYNIPQKGNYDYVGDISADINNNFQLFYRFRKNKFLDPIRDEVGINATSKKLRANVMFTELHDISTYFAKTRFQPDANKISQLSFSTDYNFTKNLVAGVESRFNFAGGPKMLTRSIKMTYLFDCVSINAIIADEFLYDSERGVKKKRAQSFIVGLKAINM